MNWSDRDLIVEALLEAYPDVDRINLSISDVLDLVVRLPQFSGSKNAPDDKYVQAVLWAWMRAADQG